MSNSLITHTEFVERQAHIPEGKSFTTVVTNFASNCNRCS